MSIIIIWEYYATILFIDFYREFTQQISDIQ